MKSYIFKNILSSILEQDLIMKLLQFFHISQCYRQQKKIETTLALACTCQIINSVQLLLYQQEVFFIKSTFVYLQLLKYQIILLD